MRLLLIVTFAILASGCATHADIRMPVVTHVDSPVFENKSIKHEVRYSQPKPGIFSRGEQLELVPLDEAELSVASSATLRNMPDLIRRQMPTRLNHVDSGETDFILEIELVARDKKGPAYAEPRTGVNFAKSMASFGLAPTSYHIIADFDAKYRLLQGDAEIYAKTYVVSDKVDHQRGDFESYSSLHDFASVMLEKHVTLTLNDFLGEAVRKL